MYNIRLVKFLETNGLYYNEQHVFRSDKSAITAGTKFVKSILNAVDLGNHVGGIFWNSVRHLTMSVIVLLLKD